MLPKSVSTTKTAHSSLEYANMHFCEYKAKMSARAEYFLFASNIFVEKCCYKLQLKCPSPEVFNQRKYSYSRACSRLKSPLHTVFISPFAFHRYPSASLCSVCIHFFRHYLASYSPTTAIYEAPVYEMLPYCSCYILHFLTIDGFYQIPCISYVEQLCKTSFSNCFSNRFPFDNVTRHY